MPSRLVPLILVLGATGAIAQTSDYSAAVLQDRPIAYYRLNEASRTTALDSSGNSRHGTYRNGVFGGGGALGSTDSAASFDGRDDFIELPGGWGGPSWPEVTVEAWVNVRTITSDLQAVVISPDANQFVHFQLHQNPVFNNVVYPNVFLPIIPQSPTGVWRHVAMTSRSGESRIYVDGVPLGAPDRSTYSSVAFAPQIRIGGNYFGAFGSGRFFNGEIDEVAIYDRALPQSRIQAHISARADQPALYLQNVRFRVALSATDPRTGRTGIGEPIKYNELNGFFTIPALTNDTQNFEVFVKILDARIVNGKFWVFYGGLTDLEYRITILDTATGQTRNYFKPGGEFVGGADTSAF